MLGGSLTSPDLLFDRSRSLDRLIQSAAVAPGPNGRYYVFYWDIASPTDPVTEVLTYAVVDTSQQGGDGAVVQKGTTLTRTTKPRMTIVRHQNNRDFWIITRDLDSRGFQSFLLTQTGVQSTPVVSLAGEAVFPTYCELKAAPNGHRLVCSGRLIAADNTSAEYVCTYDFNNATGVVTKEQPIRRLQPTGGNGAIYTASFSPDSRLLYTVEQSPDIATQSGPHFRYNDIWQYDLSRDTPAAIEQSRFKVSDVAILPGPGPEESIAAGGLQLATDGTLWVSQFHSRRIIDPITNRVNRLSAAIIRHPNVPGAGCGFEGEGYPYQLGQAPGFTLPNVVTNMLYAPPTLNVEANGCPEDSVQFWASSAGLATGLRWDFGDPASGPANNATGKQVAHYYAHGGRYLVRLTLADGRELSKEVSIAPAVVDFTNVNIFTPNGDGMNDEFIPVSTALPGGQLQIFSRWGQQVYRTTEPALSWDGTDVAPGEYFYQLEYPDCRGIRRQRRGLVTLAR
jgi:gliding motility-associated-like protein